ncbi:MAG: response regulator [Bdellovibrio sp.]
MSYRVLIADDFEDMRELLEFVFAGEMGFSTVVVNSGSAAIEALKRDSSFDLIFTDLNMPNGSGLDLFKAYQQMNLKCPFMVLSSDRPEQHPSLRGPNVDWISKPFEVSEIIKRVSNLTSVRELPTDSYVPVSLNLLKRIEQIEIPLFVRINSEKYVRLTSGATYFNAEEFEKYQSRGLLYLYIEAGMADEFIADYRKKVLSLDAWKEVCPGDHELVSINTDLLKNLTAQLGWDDSVVELAKDSIQKALHLAKNHPSLNSVFQQFHKIERYGFADHCTMTLLVACGLLKNMNYNDDVTIAKMTFASVLHDMSITDQVYDQKPKLIKKILGGEKNSRETELVFVHTVRASETCAKWDFCPPEVDQIILYHHERPDGRGFPFGRTAADLSFLCSVYILAEDIADFFMGSFGKTNLQVFLDSRRDLYVNGHFKGLFRSFESAAQHRIKSDAA